MDSERQLDQSSQAYLAHQAALEEAAAQSTHQALLAQYHSLLSPKSPPNPHEIRHLRTQLANLRLENLRKAQKLQGLKDVFGSMRVMSAPGSPKRFNGLMNDLQEEIKKALDGIESERQTQETIALQREIIQQGLVLLIQDVAKEREREIREIHRRVTRRHRDVIRAKYQAKQQATEAANQLIQFKTEIEGNFREYKNAYSEQKETLGRMESEAGLAAKHIFRLNKAVEEKRSTDKEMIKMLENAVREEQERKTRERECLRRVEDLRRLMGRIAQ